MSEQARIETSRASSETRSGAFGISSWMQITQHFVDHTSETLAHQMALGRAIASSRCFGDLMDAQTAFGQRSFQTSAKWGREIAETSQNMLREMTDQMAATVDVATASVAKNARTAEEQTRAASDQFRGAATGVARELDDTVASASQSGGRSGADTARSETLKQSGPNGQTDQTRKPVTARQ